MAEANLDPVFQIQRVYLKDVSLEQPNSPEILLNQEQPAVDIQLGVEATPVAGGRARRVDSPRTKSGMVLDNGQHILIGAYSECLKLMAELWFNKKIIDTRLMQRH